MSSDMEDARLRAYKNDPRIACQYGVKCYRKNPQHHSEYKHPPKKETMKDTNVITGTKREFVKDKELRSPQKKLPRTHESFELENLYNHSPSPESNDTKNSNEDNNENCNRKTETSDGKNTQYIFLKETTMEVPSNEYCCSSNTTNLNPNENVSSEADAQKIIKDLFLVEMPKDFFQFYNFCKSISKDNPLSACKSVCLKLVGPYDILGGKIQNSECENDKEKYLTHWRYYYDLPEFQTIIKCDDKEGLHFGYWRDDVEEKPIFVAKNRANVDCIFEVVAGNIFGAVDAYLQGKVKSANPFEKMGIMRLHSQLKNFAKQHNITLEKNTIDMQSRERNVVARTLHKAGIVVSYNKKTQLGYRDLAVTDNELQKILKQIEKADPDKRKIPITRLDEIVRLATIAADECDFGTCLELGHDLFSNGSVHVQSRALQMLSIAYTQLQRPQLLKIFEAHLKNRRKGCELSII